MARKIFGKVAWVGGVRSFFGHRTRDIRTRALAAVVSAALAAALLALAAAAPGNALEQKPDLVISHIGRANCTSATATSTMSSWPSRARAPSRCPSGLCCLGTR